MDRRLFEDFIFLQNFLDCWFNVPVIVCYKLYLAKLIAYCLLKITNFVTSKDRRRLLWGNRLLYRHNKLRGHSSKGFQHYILKSDYCRLLELRSSQYRLGCLGRRK